MSEREQKLEAALREALDWIIDCHTMTMDGEQLRHALIRKIEGILAVPPTSEWNEAIEAAAREIEKIEHDEKSSAYAAMIVHDAAIDIRALKRKEQP